LDIGHRPGLSFWQAHQFIAIWSMTQRRTRRKRGALPDRLLPVYPIGVAAKLLDIHPRTLRLYEAEGLLSPHYKGGRRIFSQSDIQWVSCLRSIIHDEGISIPGIKRLLKYEPCWMILNCPREVYETCEAKVDRTEGPFGNLLCQGCGQKLVEK